VQLADNKGEVEVIAGEYRGVKGSASTFSPINMLNLKIKAGAEAEFSFPATYNTALLVVEGEIVINDKEIAPTDHFVLMANDGEDFIVKAEKDAVVLILSGEPINEPIAAHGPFVMNTRQELLVAFDDYNKGKFGYLED
jgi:redox-sensitive bicupin YhaK (pirin superfamily)